MPVITHRRVNEMRGGRRRLSIGAVGGHSSGNTFFIARHAAGRGLGSPKDCSEHIPGSLKTPRQMLSASLPSAASPEITFGQIHSSLTPPTTPPPLSDTPSSQGPSECAGASSDMTSADSNKARACKEEMDCQPTPLAFSSCLSLVGPRPIAHVVAASNEFSRMDNESYGTAVADDGYDVASDDEVRNEPLPTPEHLIFSQSWSTWPTACHHLYSGSKFSGTQSNGTRSYVVTVTLKYVDMGVPELCGHFTIRGLTNELPKLTTYFDAQIVGSSSHSFVTNQWDASVDTDRTHWSFFPAFRQHRNRFDCNDFKYHLSMSDKYIFMRWKERFVVPNYKLSRISGASYDGFYYVCYDREEASITGYYFHRDSDHYQCLKLAHTKQASFAHFELA
ncbi:GID complex subunit 4, VID24 [Coemansia furcata]|uniref:GID complex subunit 4, VID24 n=1 Tax=Coemansia furcata TaxID=417177 RepID=A0ACC1LRE0_9FUNG|nr:GID complex subunit 4, VID24 [Coemansia furcata]